MKRIKKSLLIISFITISCLTVPQNSMAQGDPGCDPLDPTCPIDGGLSLLIAAGIGLGAIKAYENKKKAV